MLTQFLLFNIRPKLHHRKLQKSRVTQFRTFSTSPAACWCCCSSNNWKLSYKLSSDVTFTLLRTFDQNSVFFAEWCHVDRQCEAYFSKFASFLVSELKDEKLIKSKPTRKLKHANSILEYFEYFCQISSKSISIILSYTVSKFALFFWDTVYYQSPLARQIAPQKHEFSRLISDKIATWLLISLESSKISSIGKQLCKLQLFMHMHM